MSANPVFIKRYSLTLSFISITILLNLSSVAQTVSWSAKTSIPVAKVFSASFTINGIAYVGTGYSDGNDATPTNTFVKYDPTLNTWTSIAAFPGASRAWAAAFSIGGFGYVGGGVNANADASSTYFSDWYKYDPTANSWSAIASFPGSPRAGAFGFAIGSLGYVGTGFDGSVDYQDFYQYNPSTNTWTARANFAGGLRDDAAAFTIGSLAYVGTGETFNTTAFTDFYKYDPSTNAWAAIAGFPGAARAYANGFSVGTFGFVGTGLIHATGLPSTDFYQYNSTTNTWTTSTSFPGSARSGTAAIATGMNGFLGTGFNNGVLAADFFQFTTNITPLPLTLISFQGVLADHSTIDLSWATAEEENTASFDIERSGDGTSFKGIGTVRAAGNSQTERTYSWVDPNALTGLNYYRLHMVDQDNKATYSQVIALRNTADGAFAVYPNPAKDVLNIQLGPVATSGPIHVRITDASGQLVKSMIAVSAVNNVLTVNIADLTRGIYFISCNGSASRFMKQ
jgi:N-acetylneuraminic acid mutarotase